MKLVSTLAKSSSAIYFFPMLRSLLSYYKLFANKRKVWKKQANLSITKNDVCQQGLKAKKVWINETVCFEENAAFFQKVALKQLQKT